MIRRQAFSCVQQSFIRSSISNISRATCSFSIPSNYNKYTSNMEYNTEPITTNNNFLISTSPINNKSVVNTALLELLSMNEDDEEDLDKDVMEVNEDSKYLKFWTRFGKSIKLGLLEDQRNKKRLLDLLRFPTSKSTQTPLSLAQYVARMQPGQKHIYYISGPSIEEVEASPFMERLRKRDWEVLYFIDNLDEYLNLQDYDDYQFQAINKDGTEFDGQRMQDFLKEKEEEFEDLKTWLKESYGNRISKVVVSSSLTESPMAIGTAKYGYSAYMEKLTKSQAFGAGQSIKATKILQINYRHPVIIDMKNRIDEGEGEDNEQLADLANLLLDVALIKSGFEIENEYQQPLVDRVDRIVRSGLKVPLDAALEAEPEFINEFEEEDDAAAAIDNMHSAELKGKVIRVNYARPPTIKGGFKGWADKPIWADVDSWLEKQK